MRPRLERILVILGVCLPVPAFAATGLAIPLPATVERLAVALVPWADAAAFDANEALKRGARGLIVLEPSELTAMAGEVVLEPGESAVGDSEKPARERELGKGGAPSANGRPTVATGAEEQAPPGAAGSGDDASEPGADPEAGAPLEATEPTADRGGREPTAEPSDPAPAPKPDRTKPKPRRDKPAEDILDKLPEPPKGKPDEIGKPTKPIVDQGKDGVPGPPEDIGPPEGAGPPADHGPPGRGPHLEG